MASASKGYFAISEETVAGQAITVPTHFYQVQSVDFPYENQYIDNYEIRGSRQAYTSEPGAIEGTASISGVVRPGGAIALILKGLLGGVESGEVGSSDEAFEHDFIEAGSLPYFTLERAEAFAGEGGDFAQQLAGAKVESFSLECPFGDLVTYSANFQAIKAPKLVAPQSRPSSGDMFPTQRPLTFTGASVKVDGTTNSMFTNLSLEITNNLQRQNVLNGSHESYKILEGGLNCTLSGTAVFEDTSLHQKLQQGETFAVEFEITNNQNADAAAGLKEGIRFHWPNVKLQSVGTPMQANEVITSDVTFRIDFDDAANSAVGVTMTNTENGNDY